MFNHLKKLKYRADNMGPTAIITMLIALAGVAIRLFQLGFFEFKNDQSLAIELGITALNAGFRITHGMPSGIGVDNPPFFIYFMGVVVAFTRDPAVITALFAILNIAALLVSIYYFRKNLPPAFALAATALLCFSPAFITYSGNIWAQCLLPAFAIFIHTRTTRLISGGMSYATGGGAATASNGGATADFVLLVGAAVVAAQIHMSGFFLFLPLLILFIRGRRTIGAGGFIAAAILALILMIPYMYHLFFDGEIHRFISYSRGLVKHWDLKVIGQNVRMSSIDFLRYYFAADFKNALGYSTGPMVYVLYPTAFMLNVFFAAGWLGYLHFVIKSRCLFMRHENYPLAFQVSGFILTAVTAQYILLRTNTYPHYLIVCYPAQAILGAWAMWRAGSRWWGRLSAVAGVLSTVVLIASTLLYVKDMGGHPREYGPHYGFIEVLKREAWRGMTQRRYPVAKLSGGVGDKLDQDAVNFALVVGKDIGGLSPETVYIDVRWTAQNGGYCYRMHAEGEPEPKRCRPWAEVGAAVGVKPGR
jgi:hypothetical protein